MRLHGIELAKPDEWYVALLTGDGQLVRYQPVCAEPVQLPRHPELDCFYGHRIASAFLRIKNSEQYPAKAHAVYLGACGMLIGHGDSREEAISDAASHADDVAGGWLQRIIGWLETHPLSPRYRYTGGR